MKQRIVSLLLAFVMAITAVPTALAAEEEHDHDHNHDHGEVLFKFYDEKYETVIEVNEEEYGVLEWMLDHFGTLHVGGHGHILPFSSPEDQPWKNYRDGVYSVDIHEDDDLEIEDMEFWFDGCEHLQPSINAMGLLAVSPTVTLAAASTTTHDCAIGGCTCTGHCTWALKSYSAIDSSTHEMLPYCVECGATAITYITGSHTFSGNRCTLCGYTKACTHPSTKQTYITGCDWQKVCTSCGAVVSTGTTHGPYTYGSWSYYSATKHRRSYTCSYGDSGTYYETADHSTTKSYSQYSATQHGVSQYCDTCSHSVGSTTYEGHTFSYGSWENYSASQHRRKRTCSLCGYSDYEYASHSLTYGSWTSISSTQHQRTKSCSCGYSGTETKSHSFTYGSWENYNATQHRRKRTCSTCGYSDYEYENHSITTGSWTSISSTQHRRTKSCSCGYSTTETAGHSFTYGPWENYNATQHRRKRTCSTCGYSDYEYQNHSLTVGEDASISDTQHRHTEICSCGYSKTVTTDHSFAYSLWTTYSDEQHRRTKSCACGYSSYEYADHDDADGDGSCDDCGEIMTRFSVTVPASMALTVSKDGTVYAAANAAIVNNSTGAVKVTGITVTAVNGWTLVPYAANMAAAKVDSKQIGFTVNGAATVKTGASEALSVGSGWTIQKDASLPLSYNATVSAFSVPITGEQVLSLVFVVDWAV